MDGSTNEAPRGWPRGAAVLATVAAVLAVLGAIKAVITYLFLAWMGIDGVLLWAVLAVFTSLVPIVGFYALAVPPVVLALARSPLDALWTLLFFWGMSEILGDFVAPHLWSRTMRLQPVYLLFMVLAMTVTFGAAGVLVAIPVAGFLQAFLDEFYLSRRPPDDRLEERVNRMLAREVEG